MANTTKLATPTDAGNHDQPRNTTDAGKDDESRKTHRCRDTIAQRIVGLMARLPHCCWRDAFDGVAGVGAATMTSRRGARNAKKVKKNIFEKSRRYNGDYGMFKVSGVQPEGCLYRGYRIRFL
jgi:hypothetical protein